MKDSGVEWIGMIPDGWSIKKLRYVVDSFEKGSGITKEEVFIDGDTPCVRYGEIYTKYNHIFKECISRTKKDKLAVLSYFSNGDILFVGTGELVEEIGKNVVYLGEEKCLAGGDIIVAKHHENPVFLDYALNSQYVQAQKSSGKTKLKVVHISAQELKNLIVLLPPPKEQQQIADFLDAKCASIDDVIAKTNESVEEYKKLKQAMITEAVTKGVRGNRSMKDSGIDWIGQIPYDWNLQRIKTLFDLRTELNFKPLEEVNLISLYTDKGVVQHADLEKTTGNKAMNADGYKVVYENDIVVNIILCWMGAIGRSAYNGVTSPAYDVYCPKNGVESQFYHYYFRTAGFNGECFTRGRGIMLMRWRTYSDQFRDIRVVVPPLAEQKEIVKYLDSKCAAIDTLISKKLQFINELTAYKKSLIYEYVTGKKEVPA